MATLLAADWLKTSAGDRYPYRWHWHRPGGCKGRRCRVVARGTMNSALVEFNNGRREVLSRNGLRRA